MAQGSFSLKIEGLSELINAADKVGGQLPKLMYQAMVNNTNRIREDARKIQVGSFKNQTGNLRRSIFREVQSAARGKIGVGEEYGFYVETGSGPHTIVPRKKKLLRFRINGKWVFAKKVNHPGSKPYPFMQPAFENNIDKVVQEYAGIATAIVRGLAV